MMVASKTVHALSGTDHAKGPAKPPRAGAGNYARWAAAVGLLLAILHGTAAAQQPAAPAEEKKPGSPDATLYVVGTAHLDTQWLWTIQTTINEFIPSTLRDNFARIEKYPDYVFSFEGAFRYMLAEEYYPDEFARLKEYVRQNRWAVCGSWVDAVDTNVPSPESLIRHVLYGNGYFQREFGKTSCDVYLPDCFGFGYALPSVSAHCGIKGFSTQKLTWGSSVGIPFERIKLTDSEGKEREVPLGIGVWEGVDGNSLIASLNPGDYVGKIREDLSLSTEWQERIDTLGRETGAYVGYKYFGIGDQGGAPDDESVGWLQKSIAGSGPIHVKSAPADQLYRDLTPEQIAALPRYKGELLMTRHGVGCYTSQAAMKRWNRKCEQLAGAAECAAVIADWLGGARYPQDKLTEGWIRFLWHQFHDDLTGTSIPEAYPFSWNDQLIALNQFAEVYRNSVGVIAQRLNTDVAGHPLVVFNPLSIARDEVVEATVKFDSGIPTAISVYDRDGSPVPFQRLGNDADAIRIAFLAKLPSLGAVVYEVREFDGPEPKRNDYDVSADLNVIQNAHYRVAVSDDGDIVGIFDKQAGRELLSGPIQLQMLRDDPNYWPEWEIDYDDISSKPYTCVTGPAEITVVESGPVRAALRISRQANNSTVVQTIRLSAGDTGDRVEVETCVDWRSPRTLLKAAFPLSVANEKATYDLGFGTIQRGNNHEKLYEVPAQQWADITDARGDYGVSILNDSKYGWDKPADNMLRLTLIHNPDSVEKEMGFHHFCYAITGHKDSWQSGGTPWRAARMNQPPAVFRVAKRAGSAASFSLGSLNSRQVAVKALKKSEDGTGIVIRMQELNGKQAKAVRFEACAPITDICETNGVEAATDGSAVRAAESAFEFDMAPYQARTFRLRLADAGEKIAMPRTVALSLEFDVDAVSLDADRSDGDFDGKGHTLPGELLPDELIVEDIPFKLGSDAPGKLNTAACRGQRIALPDGEFNRLFLLAATTEKAVLAPVSIDGRYTGVMIPPFTGNMGQNNCFIVDGKRVPVTHQTPPFMSHTPIAWVGTHRHNAKGENEAYLFTYLHKCAIDLPPNTKTITLPIDPTIRIFAMTAANAVGDTTAAACELFDNVIAPVIEPLEELAVDPIVIQMRVDDPRAVIRFTIDGTEPTAESLMYERPFKISKSTTINARAFVDGIPNAYVARRMYRIVKPAAPTTLENVVNGLDYRCFKGSWPKLPELGSLEPSATGATGGFDARPESVDPMYAVEYTGYIRIPRQGVYTFKTRSNKGSRLYVADTLVVDNTSWRFITMERFGTIALNAGLYPIKVEYLQPDPKPDFSVEFSGPEMAMTPVPGEWLFRSEEPKLSRADSNPK